MVRLVYFALVDTRGESHFQQSQGNDSRADAQELAQEINALLRTAAILDAQENCCYGKHNRATDLPDDLYCFGEAFDFGCVANASHHEVPGPVVGFRFSMTLDCLQGGTSSWSPLMLSLELGSGY